MSTFINSFNNIKKLFTDNTIVILPGSFKPPHKGHWLMVMKYYNMPLVNKIYIFISNISSKALSSRPISKTNLKPLYKLILKFNNTEYKNTEIKLQLAKLFQLLIVLVLNISLDILLLFKNKIDSILDLLFKDIISKFDNIIAKLLDTIFKSIRTTQTGILITPQISQEIFNIYIDRYNVSDKVHVLTPNSTSPLIDGLTFVNLNITNSIIYLGVSKKLGDDLRWNGKILDHFDRLSGNIIVPKPVDVSTMISATTIRDNLLLLKKLWFPDKLTDKDFNKIKEILNQ